METKERKHIHVIEYMYRTLPEIIVFLHGFRRTFKYVNTSRTANEGLANLILTLCKEHIDLSKMTEDDICQLIFEFNAVNEHEIQLLRLEFYKFFLSHQVNVSFSFAREIYNLSHSSGYKKEILDVLLGKINWNSANAEELQEFCEDMDEHQIWKWLVQNYQKDLPKEKISKESIYKMAGHGKTFSKELLLDLAISGFAV